MSFATCGSFASDMFRNVSMSARRILGLGFFLPALACATAGADGDAAFIALENRWVEAIQKHDTAALDRLLADTFVDATFRGTLRTKKDVLTGPPAAGPYHSIRLDELAVRRYGPDTAIVTGLNVLQGKGPEDVARVRFTDVFVRKDGRWRAVSAQETLQEGGR